jgi:hypothetical protein
MMAVTARRVEYFRAEVEDRPGTAYELLQDLARRDVNLLALDAVPVGPIYTQFTLFPEDSNHLVEAAQHLGLKLLGPHPAIIIQGDDQLGALAELHRRLADARINVYAANGVTDGKGGYGYVIHVRPDDFEVAANVLGAP